VIAALALAAAVPAAAAGRAARTAAPHVIATIGVGDGDAALAVNPRNGTVYVVNNGSKTVSVINGRSNKVTATILIDARNSNPTNDYEPYEAAVSPVTGEVYIVSVAYHTGNTETVLNGKTNKVIAAIDDGGTGTGAIVISPLTGAVYVSSDISDTATLFSGQTNKVTHSIEFAPGSGVYSAAFSPRTGYLYVPGNIKHGNNYVSSVWVVSGRTGKITATLRLRGESPGQVAVSPVTGDAYIIDSSYVAPGTPVTVSVVSG
jgi:YVTN family beta-propeller protein